MATIPSSEIIAELAKHPYKQTDKVQIGGSDHYVKVFVLGTQTPKIIEDSGNPSSIAQACDDILCVGKKGIVVDGTTCYVLKETTPCGTFKRAVVFESSTNAQIVGVVDNDSVQLSTQQGGGIKVASTLPNGGDFVGQICVLTSGSTYVWTGSEWSSTAGTATLPTPSVNGGMLLTVNGSWTVTRYPAWRRLESNATLTTGKWVPFKLLTITDASGQIHLAFDIQSGSHVKSSRKCHVEFFAPDATTLGNGGVWVTEMATGQVSGTSVVSIAPDTVRLYVNPTTKEVYIAIKAISQWQMIATITNFVTNDGFTTGSNWYINQSATDVETLTDLTLVANKCYIPVPVSTASNQMLVSDGNGGWNATSYRAPIGCVVNHTNYSPLTMTRDNVYKLFYIGRHTMTASETAASCHINFVLNAGIHTNISWKMFVDCILQHNGTSVTNCRSTLVSFPSYDTGFGIGYGPRGSTVSAFQVKDVSIFAKWVDSKSCDVYMGINYASYLARVARFTIRDMFGDEDFYPVSSAQSVSDYTKEELATEGYVGTESQKYWPIPAPTSSDNGKVLKVVNGVPTWASA